MKKIVFGVFVAISMIFALSCEKGTGKKKKKCNKCYSFLKKSKKTEQISEKEGSVMEVQEELFTTDANSDEEMQELNVSNEDNSLDSLNIPEIDKDSILDLDNITDNILDSAINKED